MQYLYCLLGLADIGRSRRAGRHRLGVEVAAVRVVVVGLRGVGEMVRLEQVAYKLKREVDH